MRMSARSRPTPRTAGQDRRWRRWRLRAKSRLTLWRPPAAVARLNSGFAETLAGSHPRPGQELGSVADRASCGRLAASRCAAARVESGSAQFQAVASLMGAHRSARGTPQAKRAGAVTNLVGRRSNQRALRFRDARVDFKQWIDTSDLENVFHAVIQTDKNELPAGFVAGDKSPHQSADGHRVHRRYVGEVNDQARSRRSGNRVLECGRRGK